MEYKGAKLQRSQQNGNCDLQEGLGLGWREVAGDWECGIEQVDSIDLVNSSSCIKFKIITHLLR